jgi:hypothetical protein
MGGQVAIALVLVVFSGLMLRSFQKLRGIDPGFDARSALTFTITLPDREYASRRSAVATHRAIKDRLSVLGVTATSASTCLPLSTFWFEQMVVPEGAVDDGTLRPRPLFDAVAGGYFEATGIRLRRGRFIESEMWSMAHQSLLTSAQGHRSRLLTPYRAETSAISAPIVGPRR